MVTTGEGGLATSADPEIDRLVRIRCEHGMNLSTAERHRARETKVQRYLTTGYNYRLTDLQAVVGLAQLDRLSAIVDRRRMIARWYAAELAGIDGFGIPSEPPYARSNYQSYIVRLTAGTEPLAVMRALQAGRIHCRPGITCIHLEGPYAELWRGVALPNSERAQRETLILPLYPEMTEDEVGAVTAALKRAIRP